MIITGKILDEIMESVTVDRTLGAPASWRWVAETRFPTGENESLWIVTMYGWTKQQARRRLHNKVVRLANDRGGIV